MSEYLSPGVYAESVSNANSPIESVSSSTGGFVGISVRGALNVPTLISSWQDFLNKFAYGMETPFLANSDLAYAVYGFFQNGGTKCYIIRTASSSAAKATCVAVPESLTFTAKDEGTWANSLKLSIVANEDNSSNFDIIVKINKDIVEKFVNVSNKAEDSNYFVDVIEKSKFITCLAGTLKATSSDVSFTGGADGITDILDSDYEKSLKCFDSVDDVNLICIPGQVSEGMTKAILDYADKRGNIFAIVDGAKSANVEEIVEFRKKFPNKNGALYYPWIKVSDPLSKTGKVRECPPCGHIMGVYARTIQERGVWKAPAGTEAVIRGAVGVVSLLIKDDCDVLNPKSVNVIMPRANYGIVVWGARSLSSDDSMKYISDILLNVNVKESVKNGTQWAVFEPNNSVLWSKINTAVVSYLDGLWRAGGLAGESAEEAYFVKCDGSVNTEESIAEGKLICEVGYAPTKPAEFVIFRIAHSISNN